MVRVKKEVKCEEECFRVPGEEKIEYRHGNDGQCQNQPDRKPKPKIEYQINEKSQKRTGAVIDGENREEEVSGFALIRIATAWAAIERHKPVLEGADLVRRDKKGPLAASRAFPSCGVCHHPQETVERILGRPGRIRMRSHEASLVPNVAGASGKAKAGASQPDLKSLTAKQGAGE